LEDRLSKKTRAIMIVHLYGKPCDMDPIMKAVDRHGLKLIEDCAQSHGARYKDRMTGTFGHVNAFSFYPTKNLGCLGDGGAVVTDDPTIAESIRRLRNYGQERKYFFKTVGYNSRLDELQAGFLSVKLRRLDEINKHKRMLASLYHAGLSDQFIRPVVSQDYFDVYHIFNIRHPRRDELREFLKNRGIETEIHYPVPPHRQEALRGLFTTPSFPISEEIHSTTLSLPISFGHSPEDIQEVIRTLNGF
jgi:dTDP-4-amino-4,6-dideoxygalactose transaminase